MPCRIIVRSWSEKVTASMSTRLPVPFSTRIVERLRSSDSENQAETTTGGSASLASTTGSERTRRAWAWARPGQSAQAVARARTATRPAPSVSLVVSRLRNGMRSALTGFVQGLLDLRLQLLVVAGCAHQLPVQEERGRVLDAGLRPVALVGEDGRFAVPGVEADAERLRVQCQLAGVPFELVRQERADAFPLPAGEEEVVVLPELPLVAGALRGLRCIVRLVPKEGEILEHVPYLARVHVLLDQLRARAPREHHAERSLEVRVFDKLDRRLQRAEDVLAAGGRRRDGALGVSSPAPAAAGGRNEHDHDQQRSQSEGDRPRPHRARLRRAKPRIPPTVSPAAPMPIARPIAAAVSMPSPSPSPGTVKLAPATTAGLNGVWSS